MQVEPNKPEEIWYVLVDDDLTARSLSAEDRFYIRGGFTPLFAKRDDAKWFVDKNIEFIGQPYQVCAPMPVKLMFGKYCEHELYTKKWQSLKINIACKLCDYTIEFKKS